MTYGFNDDSGGGGRSEYDYRHGSILGFAQVHEWQTGGILVMPAVGPLATVPGTDTNAADSGFRSSFKKANDKACAGYYSVLLDLRQVHARHGIPNLMSSVLQVPPSWDGHGTEQ